LVETHCQLISGLKNNLLFQNQITHTLTLPFLSLQPGHNINIAVNVLDVLKAYSELNTNRLQHVQLAKFKMRNHFESVDGAKRA
jgi:hypothetical protein